MLSGPIVAYVFASADSVKPGDQELDAVEDQLADVAAVHLCREAPALAAPADLPQRPSDGGRIAETWLTSVGWLERALDRGLDGALASRLIVRLDWPPSAQAETALLLARLAAPTIRLAVRLCQSDAEPAFLYLNRLEFPWLAVPDVISSIWSRTLRPLCRLWSLDPRARAPVEPIQSAFGALLLEALGRPQPAWHYRVAHSGVATRTAPLPWTPSAHALFAGVASRALDMPYAALAEIDEEWMVALRAVYRSLDLGRLPEPFAVPAVPTAEGGP